MSDVLSLNAKAILLLTAPLIAGRAKNSGDVLTPGEYKKLAKHLIGLGAEPADLLTPAAHQLLGDCHRVIDKARLERLLSRGFLLSQVIEHWHARAIWLVSRADSTYPQRLKARLRDDSPPVLYGCGDRGILDRGGLAVVGSRNADNKLLEYSCAAGRLAASAGRTVVSGGARGIDQAAMRGALEASGTVIGVLADSLEKAALQRENLVNLRNGKLVLVSAYDPRAGFNVGHAMQRNKLIYALADAALVVSADLGKGGTWAGAIEQLEKLRLVPVFVRKSEGASPGLNGLAKKGALPWPEPGDADRLNAILAPSALELARTRGPAPLFSASGTVRAEEVREAGTPPDEPGAVMSTAAFQSSPSESDELFMTVRSIVLRLLRTPMNAGEVARGLGVSAPQALKWLNRLVREGALEKTKRPVRYLACRRSLFKGDSSSENFGKRKPGGSRR